MLASLLLVAVAQQDISDVQKKWAEVRAVWDGYAGVTGEMRGWNVVDPFVDRRDWRYLLKTFVVRRDGRYLLKTFQTMEGQPHSNAVLQSVELFDGKSTVVFDALTKEYAVSHDDEPPKWVNPFLQLWGKIPVEPPFDFHDSMLTSVGDPATPSFGFFVFFGDSTGSVLVLRNRDFMPLLKNEVSHESGTSVEHNSYPICKPIPHERHVDREFEWSLPPGAKLVDKLKIER